MHTSSMDRIVKTSLRYLNTLKIYLLCNLDLNLQEWKLLFIHPPLKFPHTRILPPRLVQWRRVLAADAPSAGWLLGTYHCTPCSRTGMR